MSIADHFEHAPDAKFVRSYSASTAKRQWHFSLAVVAVLAVASAALGVSVRFDQPSTNATVTGSAPPAYAGRL